MVSGCADTEPGVKAGILGANGLFFDAEDQLYVASAAGGKIWVLDRDSGETRDILGREQGVLSPDDVTIGPLGTVYFTNILHGTVMSLSAEGKVREVADLGWGVNSITLDDAGSLWVGRDFLGDGLYELDPEGQREPRTVIAKPGWINAMDFGPDGLLYGPVYTQLMVARIDPAMGEMTTVADQFKTMIHAVKFDNRGRLHVLEGFPGRVLRIDLESGEQTVLASYGLGFDNLAFDSSGRLFVSSFFDGSVHEVMEDRALREIRAPSGAAMALMTLVMLAPMVILLLVIAVTVLIVRRWRA